MSLCRLELESAGNPAFVVVAENPTDMAIVSVVFAQLKPACSHAARLEQEAGKDEHVHVVGRQMSDQRVTFTVMDSRGRKHHTQLEVVEPTFADEDRMM